MNMIKIYDLTKDDTLTTKAMSVLTVLAMHSNSDSRCFPSLRTISKEAKMSLRTVQRALDELLELGMITKKHNYRENGSQTSNIYTIISAIEERASAAVENSMQKIHDLRKRLSQAKENSKQLSIASMGNDDFAYNRRNNKTSFIFNIKKALKFTNLTMGDSQNG